MSVEPAVTALSDRQWDVLRTVEERGFVTIEGLAEEFQVSAQTIRRDIIALDAAGFLQRFHGGAGIGRQGAAVRLGHRYKQDVALDAKQRIAEQVVKRIPDGASLFLDVGTTVEAAARALSKRVGLTVFTNSMNAAAVFSADDHEIFVLGGRLGGSDGSLVGESVVAALTELRLDYALIGCSGVEDSGAVMDFDVRKIVIKKTAMRVSRQKLLLVASEKLGRSAQAQIAVRGDFDAVITEREEDEHRR